MEHIVFNTCVSNETDILILTSDDLLLPYTGTKAELVTPYMLLDRDKFLTASNVIYFDLTGNMRILKHRRRVFVDGFTASA